MIKRFYLDGNEITEPIGGDQMVSTIARDRSINAILTTSDTTFTFIEDGYNYLYNIWNTTGFCEQVQFRVTHSFDEGLTFEEMLIGEIFVSDIEFDRFNKLAKVKIQDGSYDSKINNNKSIEAFLKGGRSKNDVTITSPTPVTIELFDVATNTYIPITAGTGNEAQGYGYRLYDVMKYLVDFMTDGEIQFKSTLFDIGGGCEGACITIGYIVKGYNGLSTITDFNTLFPALTWDNVYKELKVKEGLGFLIERDSSGYILRLEKNEYLNDTTKTLISISNIQSLKTRTQRDYLYSALKFGSGLTQTGTAYHFPEDINYKGFKSEQYHTIGQCNIDSILDLSGNWVTSSNAIEEAIDRANLSEMEDTAIVLLFCEPIVSGSQYRAVKSNWIDPSSGYGYYNEHYTNYSISIRQFGNVPNSIAQFLGSRTSEFLAKTSTNSPVQYNTPNIYIPVPFDNEINDTDGVYDPTTYEMTAPASGQFSFSIKLDLVLYPDSLQNGNGAIIIEPSIEVYDSAGFTGGTLLNSQAFAPSAYTYSGTIQRTISMNISVNMNSGEKAVLKLKHTMGLLGSSYKVLSGSEFSITYSNTGGGIVQTYEPSDSTIERHEMTYPISELQFKDIRKDPRGVIEFTLNQEDFGQEPEKGNIESFKMDHEKGIATIILNSSKKLNS